VSRIVQEVNKESKSKPGFMNRIGSRVGSPSFSFPEGALYTSSCGGGRRKLRRQESSHTVFVSVAPPTHQWRELAPVTPVPKTPPGIISEMKLLKRVSCFNPGHVYWNWNWKSNLKGEREGRRLVQEQLFFSSGPELFAEKDNSNGVSVTSVSVICRRCLSSRKCLNCFGGLSSNSNFKHASP